MAELKDSWDGGLSHGPLSTGIDSGSSRGDKIHMARSSRSKSRSPWSAGPSPAKKSKLRTIPELKKPKCEPDVDEEEYAFKADARRKDIKMVISRAQALDVCFLMDATGSMEEYISMVKEEVAGMAAAIKATYSACSMRVSCLIYRDYGDRRVKDDAGCSFTADFSGPKSTFKRYLSSVRAQGGGDLAEDIFTGLERVAQLDWQATNRLLVHIGDAPCHGTRFHDGSVSDKYPRGDKYGRKIVDLLQKLYGDCNISQYFFCHVNDSTEKMLREFKNVTRAADNWIQDMPIGDISNIPQMVITIALSTIERSMSAATLSAETADESCIIELVPHEVVPQMPDWEDITPLRGRRYRHKPCDSLEELFMKIEIREPLAVEKMNTLEIHIAANSFSSEGLMRWPFYALVLDPDGARKMVVKRFKKRDSRDLGSFHSEHRYYRQMEVQTVAIHMATEFNHRTKSVGVPDVRPVEFILVSTLNAGFKFFNLEKHLKGKWIRYTNNTGYVNTKEYAETLQAFTHWTHKRSDGLLMVTDLQGVVKRSGKKYKFLLSDPAIHCRDVMRFTSTNLGEEGFRLFFISHKCNNICRKLDLTSSAPIKSKKP